MGPLLWEKDAPLLQGASTGEAGKGPTTPGAERPATGTSAVWSKNTPDVDFCVKAHPPRLRTMWGTTVYLFAHRPWLSCLHNSQQLQVCTLVFGKHQARGSICPKQESLFYVEMISGRTNRSYPFIVEPQLIENRLVWI